MIRAVITILAVFAVATLMSQGLALAWLWQQGSLNREVLSEIRVVLTGQPVERKVAADDSDSSEPALEQIVRSRAMRILELDERQSELDLLKIMTQETANGLISERKTFDQRRGDFERQLTALRAEVTAEATEQARAILLALPPETAVERLMPLSVEENVILLKGMPEKSIAKILQAFRGAPEVAERGARIFEAISRGEPISGLINGTIDSTGQGAAGPRDASG